jgi:ubiquinone/menaquinone biosynthesis C-methylase UbiE
VNPFEMGQVPFLFRQKALTAVSGSTLRPGGLTLTESAVDICGFDQTHLVLDAGCGSGTTTRHLWERYRIRSMGTDLELKLPWNAGMETPGETRLFSPGFARSRLPDLPFKSRVFNGVFCECVFSLIPDKQTCLAEFFRVLKTNGKLVLTDLYIPELFAAKIDFMRGLHPPTSCIDGALTMMALIRIIERAGFKIDIIEDHTRLLKQLAGQMVFEHGSLNNFWEKVTGSICDNSLSQACRTGVFRPGYCMIIAGKYE